MMKQDQFNTEYRVQIEADTENYSPNQVDVMSRSIKSFSRIMSRHNVDADEWYILVKDSRIQIRHEGDDKGACDYAADDSVEELPQFNEVHRDMCCEFADFIHTGVASVSSMILELEFDRIAWDLCIGTPDRQVEDEVFRLLREE